MQWIDYLKGITIILVVYYHSLLGIKRSIGGVPAFLDNANLTFLSFRMPLFFLLSGIFISKSLERKTPGKLLSSKFEMLIYPYLVWSVMQVTLQIVFGQFTNSTRSVLDYSYIFYQPRNLDQFWYLPALFNATALFVVIRNKFNPSASLHFAFALMLYFFSPYFQQVSMFSDALRFYVFFVLGDIVASFFFRESSQRFFNRRLSFLLILPVFVAAQYIYHKYDVGGTNLTTDVSAIRAQWVFYASNQLLFLVIALVGCLTMVKLSFLLRRFQILPALRVIGYHSLYIYVMHLMITGFTRIALTKFLGVHNPYVLLIFCILFGVTLPIAVYNLAIKDNLLWFLFSYRKNKRPVAAPAVNELRTEVSVIAANPTVIN